MATQPHPTSTPTHPPNDTATGAPPPVPATPAYPGGMASDPAAAAANEIVTNIKGMLERAKTELPPDLIGSVAATIRSLINSEVAKATSSTGVAPVPTQAPPPKS